MKDIFVSSAFFFSLLFFPITIFSANGQTNESDLSVFDSVSLVSTQKSSNISDEIPDKPVSTQNQDNIVLSKQELSSNVNDSLLTQKNEEFSGIIVSNQPEESEISQQPPFFLKCSQEEIDYFQGLVRFGLYSIAEQQGSKLISQLEQGMKNDPDSFQIAAIFVELYQNEWFLANELNRAKIEEKVRFIRSLIENGPNNDSSDSSLFQSSASFSYGVSLVWFLLSTAEINRLEKSQNLDLQMEKLSEAQSLLNELLSSQKLSSKNQAFLNLIQALLFRESAIQNSQNDLLREDNLKKSLALLRKMEQTAKDSDFIWFARLLQIDNYRLLENDSAFQKLYETLSNQKISTSVQALLNIEKLKLILNQNKVDEALEMLKSLPISTDDDSTDFETSFFNKTLFNVSIQTQFLTIQLLIELLKNAETPELTTEITQKIKNVSQQIQLSANPYWEAKTSILLKGILETSDQWMLVESEAEKAFLDQRYDESIQLYDKAAQMALDSKDNSNAFRLAGTVIGILEQITSETETGNSQLSQKREWESEIAQRSFEVATKYPDQELSSRIYLSGLNRTLQQAVRNEISLVDYLQKRLDFISLFPNYPDLNSFIYQTAQICLENNNALKALDLLLLIPNESELALSVLDLAQKSFDFLVFDDFSEENENKIRSDAVIWFLNRIVQTVDQSLKLLYTKAAQELLNESTNLKSVIAWTILYAMDEQIQIQYDSDNEKQKIFSELEFVLRKILKDVQENPALYEIPSSAHLQNDFLKNREDILANIQTDLFYILIEQNRPEEATVFLNDLGKSSSSLTVINKLMLKIPTLPDAIQKKVAKICFDLLNQSLQQTELTLEERKTLRINEAQALRWLGNSQESLNRFAALLKENPNDLSILEPIAEILSSQKDSATIEKSLFYWDKITRIAEEGSEIWFRAKEQMILVSDRLGKKEQTQKWIQLLKLTHPNFGSEIRKQKMEQLLRKLQQ